MRSRIQPAVDRLLNCFAGPHIALVQRLNHWQQFPANVRELYRVVIPDKQCHLKLLLQGANLPAHGGLGNIQFFRGHRKAAQLRRLYEALHLKHRHILIPFERILAYFFRAINPRSRSSDE